MKNQMGFSILNFCFLIPIIFSACLLVMGSYQLIVKYTDTQRECRTHVLRAQQVLGQKLKNLLDLNPQATALRIEERNLRIALQAARLLPPVAAILQAKLYANQLQQSILRGKQEMILAHAKLEARAIMADLPSKIRGSTHSNIHLKVYKNPPLAIAPDHHTVPFFREAQALKVNWKMQISEFVPQIILDIFATTGYPKTITGFCAATLVQKGDVWNPKLHLAKF